MYAVWVSMGTKGGHQIPNAGAIGACEWPGVGAGN